MNLKDFKAGVLKQQFQYQSFTPSLINHSWVWNDPKINTLLEEATRALGELNAFSLISRSATHQLIETFVEAGILTEMTWFKRNRLFQFKPYFELFLK